MSAKTAIDNMVELRCGTKDGQYLTSLESALQQASRDFQPDLILYNAGTDILEGDPLGRSVFTYALRFMAATHHELQHITEVMPTLYVGACNMYFSNC